MSLTGQEALSFLLILELDPNKHYEIKDFKKSWKNLCQRYHPDKHTEEAYKSYQEELSRCREVEETFKGEHKLSPQEAHAKFVEITHAYRMLTDRDYSRKEKMGNHPSVDLTVTIPMNISFDEAFFGTEQVLNIAIREYDEDGLCLNEGENPKPLHVNKVPISIPSGIYEPTIISIAGKGCIRGNKKGDVRIIVHPQPSDKFIITPHKYVESQLVLPLKTMLMGGDVDVLTMYGIKTAIIPPGAQPGLRVSIPNCGVDEEGYHIAIVQIPKIPNESELRNDPAWDGLDLDKNNGARDRQEKGPIKQLPNK